MKLHLMTATLLALTACDGPSASGDPGFETGPCIEGECFDGLECLSDLCVGPQGSSSAGSGNPSSGGPITTSNSGSGPSSASDTSDGSSASASDTSSSASASASDSAADSTDSGLTSDGTTTGGFDDDSTTGDPTNATSATTNSGPSCGDGDIDPGEQCDGNNLQGFSCNALGLGSGTLGCDPVMCTFDTSMCGTSSSGTGG